MHLFVTLLCLLAINLNALSLRDRVSKGRVGDFIIVEQNHTCSLLCIRERSRTKLVLEEITLPERALPTNLEKWLEQGAPGHTSWIHVVFDVANSSVKDIYSFTLGEWIAPQGDSLLLAILNHSLTPVPEGSREGADTRALWTPPPYFAWEKSFIPPPAQFWSAIWKSDGWSFFSQKITSLFPSGRRSQTHQELD